MNSEKPVILFVDDEERIIRSLKLLFRGRYEVLTTTDGREALEMLRNQRVHAIISDQRMPIMPGVEVLRGAREISPNTMRLLLTGYSDMESIIGSVNEGEVFRFINKPWKSDEIIASVDQAVNIALAMFEAEEQRERLKSEASDTDSSNYGFLVIDDDNNVHNAVSEAVQSGIGQQSVYWATTLEDAFELLVKHPIAVVLSEIRLQGEDISGAIKVLKQKHPEIMTIVITSYEDTGLLIDLINQGQVYRYLPKPVPRTLLGRSLLAAVNYYKSMGHMPSLAKRHVVEQSSDENDKRVIDRVMGFLGRMRSRLENAPLQ